MDSRSRWPAVLGFLLCACGDDLSSGPTAGMASWGGADNGSLFHRSYATATSFGWTVRAAFYDGDAAPTCEVIRNQRSINLRVHLSAAAIDEGRPVPIVTATPAAEQPAATLEIEGHVYESGLLTVSSFGEEYLWASFTAARDGKTTSGEFRAALCL